MVFSDGQLKPGHWIYEVSLCNCTPTTHFFNGNENIRKIKDTPCLANMDMKCGNVVGGQLKEAHLLIQFSEVILTIYLNTYTQLTTTDNHQAWWQKPLPAGPSHRCDKDFYLKLEDNYVGV